MRCEELLFRKPSYRSFEPSENGTAHSSRSSERTEYGERLLKRLLSNRFGRGFPERNLEQMRLANFADTVCEIDKGVLGSCPSDLSAALVTLLHIDDGQGFQANVNADSGGT